jgi:hypothetical protein
MIVLERKMGFFFWVNYVRGITMGAVIASSARNLRMGVWCVREGK